MNGISIRTVADMKRALALPGVLVFVDRNDHVGGHLARSPAAMAEAMRPRTVEAVRSGDTIMLRNGGRLHIGHPKAADLSADGTNVYTVTSRERDGRPDRMVTYRLELPGTPGASVPSRLPESHPPVDAATLAAEAEAAAAREAERAMAAVAHEAERARVAAIPLPTEDPRHAALTTAMEAAIAEALGQGLFYDRDVEAFVARRLGDAEYARMERLPDAEPPGGTAGWMTHVAQQETALELGRKPRGSYLVFMTNLGDGHSARDTMVSTGAAKGAIKFEGSFADEGPEAVLRRMRGGEVYDLRKKVEADRKRNAAAEAMSRRRFAIGQNFHKLRIDGMEFSTATVTAADAEAGTVALTMAKRGSPKHYTVTLKADALDRLSPLPAEAVRTARGDCVGNLGI